MFLKIVFVTLMFYTRLKGDSIEEMSPFIYSNTHTVNFHDIFPYTTSLMGGETAIAPEIKDDETYNLHILPAQLVEFSTMKSTESYTTTTTAPLPKYVQNLNQHQQNMLKVFPVYSIATEVATTPKRDHYYQNYFNVKYLGPQPQSIERSREEITLPTTTYAPVMTIIPGPQRERGILDLLFPPRRVKTFKSVFDTLKSILSYTFKR